MEITLLGTGDTTGTPTVGCECETCTAARDRGIERSRFSVHVRNEQTDESILIDTSPDFRAQFLQHDVSLPDAIVITHIHFDHIDGLGNAFRVFRDLPVFAGNETDPETGESVAETIRSKFYYLNQITVEGIAPFEPVQICGLDITIVPVDHPPYVCYGVIVEDPIAESKLSITGDTSYAIPADSRAAMREPDLLLADGIVPAAMCEMHPIGGDHHGDDGVARTFGAKHMTREGALALARELDAQLTRLVHVAHYYPVSEAFAPPLAVDGEHYSI